MTISTPRMRTTGKRTTRSPRICAIQADFDRMRFQAAVAHVDRGRVLKQSGDMQGALTEFTRALQIDPGNQAAQQEIDLLQSGGKPRLRTPRLEGADGRAE